MDIVLIRHTSVGVPKGTCYGWSDVPVADTFETEAEETKKNLGTVEFDAVFSSPLTRARKLAAFCGYDTPIVDDRLKEMNMGDWEMKNLTRLMTKIYRNGMTTTCILPQQMEKVSLNCMQGYRLF